jgi:hypothetical protein
MDTTTIIKQMLSIVILLISPFVSYSQTGPQVKVINNCPFSIWSHAFGFNRFDNQPSNIDNGNATELLPGAVYYYNNLVPIYGGRIYAYYKEPLSFQSLTDPLTSYNEFIEFAIDAAPSQALNYNISYVDYASLPVYVKAGNCNAASSYTCLDVWKNKLALCPTELRNQYNGIGTCLSSFTYCDIDPTISYCTKMDRNGYSGRQIYGGVFSNPGTDVAFWDQIAAWNRGTFPGDPDPANYYVNQPYNEYAKWVHETLGFDIYAFSTDDHQSHGGFVQCANTYELEVTWCPCEALPVKFINFEASVNGSAVALSWVTSNEMNNDYFVIEKSADGVNFMKMEIMKGKITKTETTYFTEDKNPFPGINYYKIRQVDKNGEYIYSTVKSVDVKESVKFKLLTDPEEKIITIVSQGIETDKELFLKIIDLSGKVIQMQFKSIRGGSTEKFFVDISTLSSGVYILSIGYEEGIYFKKFLTY